MIRLTCLLIGLTWLAGPALAEHRFRFAAQDDWGAQRGFYLSTESKGGEPPFDLADTGLFLGVADGTSWRFLTVQPAWEPARRYTVRAVIAPDHAELWLNGEQIANSVGGFQPQDGPLQLADVPSWARDATTFLLRCESIRLLQGERSVTADLSGLAARPLPLVLFEPGAVTDAQPDWTTAADAPLLLEATFHFDPYPSLRELAPFIDAFGQSLHADWPGKVRSMAELRDSVAEEAERLAAVGLPEGYDRYGGSTDLGWSVPATGFYQVLRRDEVDWLISPAGNPCFFLGMSTGPATTWPQTPLTGREYLFAWLPDEPPDTAAYGENPWGSDPGVRYWAPHTPNLIRKYGDAWQTTSADLLRRRLGAWGFSGLAKWAGSGDLELPVTPVLGYGEVPRLVRRPDFLDPAVADQFRQALNDQIAEYRDSPWVVGWTVGSEYDEIVTPDEITAILALPPEVPSRRALVMQAVAQYGDANRLCNAWGVQPDDQAVFVGQPMVPEDDVEQLRRWYADAYYAFCYRTVKELDPNHLYLGNYVVPGWWVNEQDWFLIGAHCDVMSLDYYHRDLFDERLRRLIAALDKPVYVGEFSFPAFYGGLRGFGQYPAWAHDDAHSGELYAQTVAAAAEHPRVVGMSWFQYRDQPLTGRGAGHGEALVYGEHYAFGVVDVADRPKWDLVDRMRAANLAAAKRRNALR